MKLFVDTNVVIDLLAHRQPFYEEAKRIFSLPDNGNIDIVVSSLSFSTVSYILEHKVEHDMLTDMLRQFASIIEISSIDEKIVERSISADCAFLDIEDAMQHYSAVQSGCEMIITRNPKDFKSSVLPVFTPKNFIRSYEEAAL